MAVVEMKRPENKDVITVLEYCLELAKAGEMTAVGVSWVTPSGGIARYESEGPNAILMWAALEDHARSFREDYLGGEE